MRNPISQLRLGTAERLDATDWSSLMAAAQAGDQRAYASLLQAITPMLRSIARRRLHDATEAEDAVKDTLLTVHRLRHAYDPTRPLRPWLVALCERRCIDRLRRRGRRRARETSLDALEPGLSDVAGERNAGEERVVAAELHRVVGELPQSQRVALRLTKLEGLALSEAAVRSGLSVGALKVATHRAIRALRRRLAVDTLPV